LPSKFSLSQRQTSRVFFPPVVLTHEKHPEQRDEPRVQVAASDRHVATLVHAEFRQVVDAGNQELICAEV